jgi:proline iminopeptidase
MRKFLIAVALLAWLWTGRFGSTPPFRDGAGKVQPGSVAEMQRVMLGGVEQSIVIRGRDARAPILIWLHGGPGTDETGMWRRYNAALEDHFVVVYWTQRGTGRSFHTDIPIASMTLPQFIADLDQLVALLQARFHQPKVALAGHSWGTNIGVAYALAHPAKVSAYVGIGQIANSAEGERRSYAFTLAEATRRRDAEALAASTALGPPPYRIESIVAQRGWLEKFGGGSFRVSVSLPRLMWQSYQANEVTWLDGLGFARGTDFSLAALAPQVAGLDWLHTATRFAVPVFILAGRYDHNTDADLAHSYFERIEAPYKRFVWFERSAHSPPFEQPAAFNAMMIESVLPVVRASLATPPAPVDSKAVGG